MSALLVPLLSALVGAVHVHHEPSHDSDAPFEEVLDAAFAAELDFLVLTEHVPSGTRGALPAADRAGVYAGPDGGQLLVLVGVELATPAGHLLALDVAELPEEWERRPARATIASIHALGGFAVVPHPFSHGGWNDWEAPFDGLEVHNNASAFRGLGLRIPVAVMLHAFSPERALGWMLARPERELAQWERLLRERRVVAFSGADAHRNISLLGWQLDPYEQMFEAVQTVCPEGPLEPDAVWGALRRGRCRIHYAIHDRFVERDGAQTYWVEYPSGRLERWVRGTRRVIELRQAPAAETP